jgi:hypothetical protein
VTLMREQKGAYRVFVGRPEGSRWLGRPGCRWKDNIKMDLQEAGWWGVDWIVVAQGRGRWGGGCCECDEEPSGSTKCGQFLYYMRTC